MSRFLRFTAVIALSVGVATAAPIHASVASTSAADAAAACTTCWT